MPSGQPAGRRRYGKLGDFMATCIRCGREMPASAPEGASPLCRDCRADLDPTSIEAVTAPPPVRNSQPFLLTQVIVGVNVLVFLIMVFSGVSPMAPTVEQLVKWGANFAPLSLGSQPWRMLISNYVHIGIIHIFFNMWCLWNLGRLAERIFDRWTYLLVYTASGIGGSLASLWWHPKGIGAGASGAIFGLAGGLIAVLYLGKLPIAREALKPTLKSLITFAAYNLFFGLVPGIDNAAHLGGLAAGLGLGAVLAGSVTEPPEIRARWRNYALVGTTLLFLVANGYLRQRTGKLQSSQRLQDHYCEAFSSSASSSFTKSAACPRTA
jgi:membrane associated rhomboid family serine protease